MIRIQNPFRTPSEQELIAIELDQAHRSLLEALSAREYADAMCSYHQARIERLGAALRAQS